MPALICLNMKRKNNRNFDSAVYEIVKMIPRGKVSTYGEIAKKFGSPKYARAVGQALKRNRRKDVPCHRVVRSDGRMGGYSGGYSGMGEEGSLIKERLLREEGVEVINGRVDLKRFLFRF